MLGWLVRDGAWLGAARVRGWSLMLAGALCLWGGAMLVAQLTGAGWGGLGGDFPCFYAAGVLARHGQAALVYAPAAMSAAEHALGGMKQSAYLPFFYPPPFLLVCWGLAWLPYWTAFAVFMASGLVPLAAAARVLLPAGMRWLPFVAYPGIWITFLSGQNGLIFAACLAWFMLLGDRRPGGAGACLGVLVCKPHLGLGVPFALAASGRWRSFAAAGACALVLCAASWAVLGAAPWVAFAQAGRAASTAITAFLLPFGSSVVAAGTHVQVAPLVIGALLVLLARDRGRGAHAPIETEHGWAVARPE